MDRQFAYNVALSHWREMIAKHGADKMRDKLADMVFCLQPDPNAVPALQQALAEEGEGE